ncbi:hypothetical protein TVNIR_0515 [Thioalkalivibrio nitratireducens DSM 14787]|uniref:Polymerase beta nucleotidyltransferase domain-containing protein n=1 Tax=Thioalkalivibrio nitratireducens (strain DSM 14787 / UNIQEM 213 / ALEN2) TaxID=1255043 RepID=L0DT99_THIND|nr:nucleotidyltransferase domain-containing protein [Thioalkalivibrio nitratireducens]AGA32217.1 hypothetical protein TVNIR_0515 [Thioalkalivibrio nitratireducens DSM 14787]
MELQLVRDVFESEPDLELAILIGSRQRGTATPASDWDFAIQWARYLGFAETLAATERLRHRLAKGLDVAPARIDLIDLAAARLAIRAVVAEEGRLLKGDGTRAWSHFLTRTWRELEDWAWESEHAA